MAVIKEGYGDMAVSNAVGSNVFDILICLGLPWLIQTTIIDAGGHVNVISKGLSNNWIFLIACISIKFWCEIISLVFEQGWHIPHCRCCQQWYFYCCQCIWMDGNLIDALVSFWWSGISYSLLWHRCMNWTCLVISIHHNAQVSAILHNVYSTQYWIGHIFSSQTQAITKINVNFYLLLSTLIAMQF